MNYYVVKYSGPFGFIKPWTAVRDSETFSQQFLTPSIVEGIEKKLFPEMLSEKGIQKIKRHRLSYTGISTQQEQTQPRGWNIKKNLKLMERPRAILMRGIMIQPILYLAFDEKDDAVIASRQHICLCRNEDILLPDEGIIEVANEQFDYDQGMFNGFELILEENDNSFLVGFNRFNQNQPMYGWIKTVGNPIRSDFK